MMSEKKALYLHPARIRAVIQVLQMVFEQGKYADKAIAWVLKNNPKAGAKDRSFIAEHAYEVVRYFRFYYTALGRVPNSEADWWKLLGIYFVHRGHDLPPFAEFDRVMILAGKNLRLPELQNRATKESIPDWLDKVAAQELGEEWPETLHALNQPAEVVLRTNTLLITRTQLRALLHEEFIETIELPGNEALQLVKRSNVFATSAFKKGLFEVQDLSSQQVAHYLEPEPGHRVIDACAGAGGKTLHIAALMQNKGSIIAMDTLSWKLQELKQRARRNGIHNIRIQQIDSSKTLKRLRQSADRVLLDVPCSGLGVLRRNPDSKWKLSEEFLDEVRQTQQQILQEYTQMCKPNGLVVYATCSILPSENQNQIQKFLESETGGQFRLVKEQTLMPQAGFDGFYMAQLRRL